MGDRKKNVSFEVRISDADKEAFVEACKDTNRSASEVVRDMMNSFSSSTQSDMSQPVLSRLRASLWKPVLAIGFLVVAGLTGIVGPLSLGTAEAENEFLILDVTITDTISTHEIKSDINFVDNGIVEFRLIPIEAGSDAFHYTMSTNMNSCDALDVSECGQGNVLFSFEITKHDQSGTQIIADPQIIVRQGGHSSLSLVTQDGGVDINTTFWPPDTH